MTERNIFCRLPALVLGGTLFATPAFAVEYDQTHALLTSVLTRHVKDARVDYAALKARPQDLNRELICLYPRL